MGRVTGAIYHDDVEKLGLKYEYQDFNGKVSELLVFTDEQLPGLSFTITMTEIKAMDISMFKQYTKTRRAEWLEKESLTMMDKIIRMYYAYQALDVRSPIPHLVGPPGVGKSSMLEELAAMLEVNLHIFNVARISPLELEGVQMPSTSTDGVEHDVLLKLLHNPMWTRLKDGDIVLLDEFMRGFPEVYNGMLDILTSRRVAGFQLPRVFFIAASNSVSTYDEALRDRLLNIMVPDIRNSATAKTQTKTVFVRDTGMNPDIINSQEMDELITAEVLPMFDVLDALSGKNQTIGKPTGKGHSIRNLVGQALLREVQSPKLRDLIDYNNRRSIQAGKFQFVLLLSGRRPDPKYVAGARKLIGNPSLTEIQANNLKLNLQLIEMEEALKETLTPEKEEEDDLDLDAF